MGKQKILFVQPLALDRERAFQAACLAFENPDFIDLTSLVEAENSNWNNDPALVVAELAAAQQAYATRSRENPGFPRWAVVGLGNGSLTDVEIIPPEEWNVSLLARVFRHAVREHELRLANLRHRGDLMTIARRISHDLRTPISCINTNAELLKEFGADDKETLRSTATVIQESVAESMAILNRVGLVLAASAEIPKFEAVNMGVVVGNVLKSLQPLLDERHRELDLPSDWPQALGVSAWCAVIWTNLLRNCLEHAGDSAKIKIAWDRVVRGIRFSVTDNGPGISSARVPEIFAHFDQLHKIRARGLGLSIVHRLVTLQGGKCGHENLPHGGSSFYFSLPCLS